MNDPLGVRYAALSQRVNCYRKSVYRLGDEQKKYGVF